MFIFAELLRAVRPADFNELRPGLVFAADITQFLPVFVGFSLILYRRPVAVTPLCLKVAAA